MIFGISLATLLSNFEEKYLNTDMTMTLKTKHFLVKNYPKKTLIVYKEPQQYLIQFVKLTEVIKNKIDSQLHP